MQRLPGAKFGLINAAFVVFTLVVSVLIWVLLAFKVRAGRNWARVLVIVLWLFGAVGLWAFFSQYPSGVSQILAVVPSLLILAAIVAMAVAQTSRLEGWFIVVAPSSCAPC